MASFFKFCFQSNYSILRILRFALIYIEWLSTERRKNGKTKEISLANHKLHRQPSEPIKTRGVYAAQSAGKQAQTSHHYRINSCS